MKARDQRKLKSFRLESLEDRKAPSGGFTSPVYYYYSSPPAPVPPPVVSHGGGGGGAIVGGGHNGADAQPHA